jgi:2-polyprenyl-3-methyl-5-hydroxy-6-metoxy-1,4-benzoquinol methylase
MPNRIDPEWVTWGYRLFLDREPESRAAVEDKVRRLTTAKELREEFVRSPEFVQREGGLHVQALSGHEPPLPIETDCSEAELQVLFKHLQDTWHHLGETEPHWSVMSTSEFTKSGINEEQNAFYQSGKKSADLLFATMQRNAIDPSKYKSCLEYGCGLGRVTRWLAERFETVLGYDISGAHLKRAGEYLTAQSIRNVALRQISSFGDIRDLPKADVIFCIIVLQHNPPPMIGLMIRGLIGALNSNGVALFQVPTYRRGYSFSLKKYLEHEALKNEMEIHFFPQRKVFEIAKEEGGRPIEVLEDGCLGARGGEMSNTFLIQKE